jgi:hypothetical protein
VPKCGVCVLGYSPNNCTENLLLWGTSQPVTVVELVCVVLPAVCTRILFSVHPGFRCDVVACTTHVTPFFFFFFLQSQTAVLLS